MPLPWLAAVVVYCTTFLVLLVMLTLWRKRFIAETAALLSLAPAILAYAVMS